MTEIKIGEKTIFVVVTFLVGIVLVIFSLNKIDGNRKMKQVAQLYNIIETSPYQKKLKSQVAAFDTSRIESVRSIIETLNLIDSENEEIYSLWLMIQRDDTWFELSSYYYDYKDDDIKYYSTTKNLSMENEEIVEKLLEFNDGETSVVEFYIPSIHCSSCIWVLENLSKLNDGVTTSMVNFPKKILRATFKNKKTNLKEIVELATSIGYEPYISLEDADAKSKKVDKTLIYEVSIAAFCFGNIMLLSFPEYFQVDGFWLEKYKYLFR